MFITVSVTSLTADADEHMEPDTELSSVSSHHSTESPPAEIHKKLCCLVHMLDN